MVNIINNRIKGDVIMKEAISKVLQVKVGEKPVVKDMELTLENMQEFVEGYVECVRMPFDIDIWINDEGKIIEKEKNIILLMLGEPYDVICGNALFTSHDDEGDSIGLSDTQLQVLESRMRIGITNDGNEILAIEMGG